MSPLLGRNHPTVRRLRALRRDAAARAAESVFVAEGVHLAQEALRAKAQVELMLVSPRLAQSAEGSRLLRSVEAQGLTRLETSDAILAQLQDARSPQPVLTLIRRPNWPEAAGMDPPDSRPLLAVAHAVQDPGNLGGILRSAHAAGATAAVVCGPSADRFHPRAVRASMGAILHLPTHAATADALLRQLRGRVTTIGVAASASKDYHACDLRRPVALWFGHEGSGLPDDLLDKLDESVRITMRPGVDSISVGAAAAVLLFEAARQRGIRV